MTETMVTCGKSEMLIRRPAHEVFEALVDPKITTKFWFTDSTGRLEPGKKVRWSWAMYGASADVDVKVAEKGRRLLFDWGGGGNVATVEILFSELPGKGTFVRVTESVEDLSGDALVERAMGQTAGWTYMLSALKALLEHGVVLKVVADAHPDKAKS